VSDDQDVPCPHLDFTAMVEVVRLEDTARYSAAVRVWCSECQEPFLFPRELPVGLDLAGVTTNVAGDELRVAIRPSVTVEELGGG
jgi:hypothetical protein